MHTHTIFLAVFAFVLSAVLPLRAAVESVALPVAETNQPRTRSASIAGHGTHLYFTRYWANVLPGTNCAFYRVPYGMTGSADWATLAPAPKFVQEPPGWFSADIMQTWASNGMSAGEIAGQPFLFMFGSVAKGGVGEDIGRDLLGYNINADVWEVVTNRYDTGGTDAACTFVDANSIYGFWTGWTPMQRWVWDKNSLGIVQQATVGAAALHPVAGTRVGNLGVFVVFQSGAPSAKLIAHTAGTLDTQLISTNLLLNVGMGCAIEHVPAAMTASGSDELWILRGGAGDNSGDGQANNTPSSDVLVLTFTNTPTAIAITTQRIEPLPFATGAEGSDMARVSNRVYFLRYNGATNPELYSVPANYQVQDPPDTPWPLCGNNKQRQGWYTNGLPLLSAMIVWSNITQTTAPGGIWYSQIRVGSGVTDGQRFYIAVNPALVNNNATLLALDLVMGTSIWNGVLGGANNYANGTPAVSPNSVYIGESTSDGGGSKRQVYRVDKTTGQIVWSNRLDWMVTGGMLLHNGRLYFESDWEVGLWCLDADSGMTLWTNRYGAGEWASNGPTLSPDGTTIYAHGDDGKFVAIDATSGNTLWSQQFAESNGNLDPIVDAAGNIYCGFQGVVSDAEPDILVKFAPDGSNLWRMSFDTNVWGHGGYALSPDGARIYCSVDLPPSTGLVAVDTASGAVLWSSACGGTGGGCVVGAPGDVIIGVFDIGGGVAAARAVRDEGSSATILWTIPLSPTIPGGDGRRSSWSWPTLLENGDVIVESSYGVIARITVPEPTFIIGVSLMGLCGLRRRR
jgi:outer membrane protein assembly factor BamB